jgi:outer membrane receptor protein involved in Fe transport
VKFEGGSFDTYRGVALLRASLPISGTSAYFGGEIFGSRGYFEMPQDYNRTNLFAKVYSRIGTNGSLSAAISGFGSAWNASGQIPERAVRRGEITRFGSIDSLEGGATARTTAIVHYNSGGSSPLNITGSFTDYRFRLYSNFTFFLEDTARGDMIEQTDHRSTVSLKAENDIYYDLFGVPMHSRIGADLRSDDIRAALYHDSARTRLTTRRDALIRQSQTGLYGEQEIILPFAQILLGMRFDYIGFDVESLAEEGAGGIQQQAIVSPKANISIPVTDEMTLFLNSGFGFHSNDARVAVAEASRSTLPRAFGVETGIRYDESGGLFSGSAAAWMLDLESEIVYVGDEGATEPSGRTRRQGIDLEAHVAPLPWLTVGADATLSRGRFIDAPTGADYIPLAPNLTLSANVMAHLGDFTAAARLRAVDDRPANEDNSVRALGYSIVDLSAAYRFGRTVEGFLNVENLLDAEWNEAQFDTESRLRNEREPTDELHFTPGAPRSIRVGAAVHF